MNVRKRMHTGKFFIQEHLDKKVNHGGIGLVDIEKILIRENYIPINFPYHYRFSFKAKCFRLLYLLKTLALIPAGSIVLYQFPLYAGMHQVLIRLLQLRKSITLVCLVADINGLKDGNERLLQKELVQLRRHHLFIVHNNSMERWLSRHLRKAVFSQLTFFDFLASPSKKVRTKSHTLVFAGNLAKSLFLEHLGSVTANNPQLGVNLYGPGVTSLMLTQRNVNYKGAFDPYSLPAMLEGSFGLVWDGDAIEGPVGSFGSYMHFITHHKVSLYVLAKLPIIVYEHAGSAEFIVNNKLGFAIKNLYEINDRIDALNEEEYLQMIVNLQTFSDQISSGRCLVSAIGRIVDKCSP